MTWNIFNLVGIPHVDTANTIFSMKVIFIAKPHCWSVTLSCVDFTKVINGADLVGPENSEHLCSKLDTLAWGNCNHLLTSESCMFGRFRDDLSTGRKNGIASSCLSIASGCF